jgi:hypothetical protein
MVRVVVAAVLAGTVVWLGGCAGSVVGGEDGDGGMSSGGKATSSPSMPSASAPKQCETYVNTWCNRSFTCYVEVGRLDAGSKKYNVDQCKKLLIDNLPCSAVQTVGSSYPTCISQIKSMACSSWDVPKEQFASVPFPSSCDEALSF